MRQSTGKVHDPILYLALLSALEGTSMELFAKGGGPTDVARAKAAMHLLLGRVLDK